MKKMLMLLLCIPFFTNAQNKNVINATRVFPKVDKIDMFEKAIALHAQKFHKGDWAWRVFYIETGTDAGGYQFVEGPNSWTTIDGRGELGQTHTDDWNKNVSIYLTDRTSNFYLVAIDSLGTGQLAVGTEKAIVTHVFPKPGYGGEYINHLKKMKKTWAASNQNVVVYQTAMSGKAGYLIVNRLQNGLKELEEGYRAPFRERYEKANGASSYQDYLQNIKTIINDENWSELIILQPKLGSPKM